VSFDAVRKKLPNAFSRPDFEMAALDYFRRLGQTIIIAVCPRCTDGQRRKPKQLAGTQAVDYEKIGATAVQAMSTADLHRFLVVCALASDLYCPGYNPKQTLPKDSNLARAAVRYKSTQQK